MIPRDSDWSGCVTLHTGNRVRPHREPTDRVVDVKAVNLFNATGRGVVLIGFWGVSQGPSGDLNQMGDCCVGVDDDNTPAKQQARS